MLQVSVEDALQEFNIKFERRPEYFGVRCPFHDDERPSATVHHKTGIFRCFACGKKTSLALYLVKYSNLPFFQVKHKLGARSDCKNPLASQDIERYHQAIWEHKTYLDALRHRTLTDNDIRKYKLGVIDQSIEKRITIPIQNDIGEYCNLRMYIPGAVERKFTQLSTKDRNKVRYFPIDQLEYDTIALVPGEIKAIAAARELNSHDIGAVSLTCGENTPIPGELIEKLKGKLVYVIGDVDDSGKRSAELRCRLLKPHVRELYKVEFSSEEVSGEPKGDVNDFLRCNPQQNSLYNKLISTKEWVLVPGGEFIDEAPLDVEFREAFHQDSVGKRLRFTAIVTGTHSKSYLVPSDVEVRCNRNEPHGLCQICDVNSQAIVNIITPDPSKMQSEILPIGLIGTNMKIGKEHPSLLALIGERKDEHSRIYKETFKIPSRCRQCVFDPKKQYSVIEVLVDEQLEPTSREEPLTMKNAYFVNGPQTLAAETFILTGRLYPSPKNQISSFLVSECEPTADALEAYHPPDFEELRIFQPKEWTIESIQEKLNDIYQDFEANVTHIYFRRDYHLAVDLVYHSILHFKLDTDALINGWLELLAIGDTSQGKTDVVKYIQSHYHLGFKVDSKGVTLPGLTIGIDTRTAASKTFSVIGVLPRNDRKLVIFEELKGMNQKVWQALTEIRSSGVVQISKIEQKTRRARVRIIAITNPIRERKMSSYVYGIDAALGIIGTHEDLRRFDLVYCVGESDIDQEELSQMLMNPPTVEHKYTNELCQKLVLKAWKCENVTFESVNHIIEIAKKLLGIFGDGPPVLGSNSCYLKVAKLSAALAARTCSYQYIEGKETLIVRKCHTEYIRDFLIRIYSSPSCRLDEKSRSVRDSIVLRDKDDLIRYIREHISRTKEVMTQLLNMDTITPSDLKDLIGDVLIANGLLARLIQSNALARIKSGQWAKTSEFTELLKRTDFSMKAPPKYLTKYTGNGS